MYTNKTHRIFLSAYFFLSGFSFATWASRIPTIKFLFHLNDAELGTLLLCLPISSLVGLPLSGWLVSRFHSRVPLVFAFMLHAIALCGIGLATSLFSLIIPLCVYAFTMRITGIAMNTQALTLQKTYNRKINGAFHGLWSTGGIAGVALSTSLVAYHVPVRIHLPIVSLIIFAAAIFAYRFLLQEDRTTSGNKLQLSKPDPFIVYLGLLVFFAGICEGGMFDWSGLYFREVIGEEIFTLGYLIFIIFMALSRFASDWVVAKIGVRAAYVWSASLIVIGIFIAVAVPYFWPALFGFCLLGIGTASIIPLTFTQASYGKKYSPGLAISIIATYSLAGAFLGPPLIGYLAHGFGLRWAFITFGIAGASIIPISLLFFYHQQSSGESS